MFTITTTIDCYLLPEDGAAAKQRFLDHLQDPHDMWIIAYSFTLMPMIDEIVKNSSPPGMIHIYLDLSQSRGTAEKPQVQRLIDAGVEVTIGTSPAGLSFITHTKGIVCNDTPVPWCWEGSVNFSESGWMQVNTAMVFNDTTWRDNFVAQFDTLRDYAWTNERADQLMKAPPSGVTIGTPNAAAPATGGSKKAGSKKAGSKKSASKSTGAKAGSKKTDATKSEKLAAKKSSKTKPTSKKASK